MACSHIKGFLTMSYNVCYTCPSSGPNFRPLQYFPQYARQTQAGTCVANIIIHRERLIGGYRRRLIVAAAEPPFRLRLRSVSSSLSLCLTLSALHGKIRLSNRAHGKRSFRLHYERSVMQLVWTQCWSMMQATVQEACVCTCRIPQLSHAPTLDQHAV